MNLRSLAFSSSSPGPATALACLALVSDTSAAAQTGTYLEQNGLVSVQFESAPAVDGWTLSTATPGHTGDGYFRWDGPDLFFSPGAEGVFGFDFEVETTAEWLLALHNRHEHPDPTEENDVWIRMDNDPWIKVFSNMAGSVGDWTWETRFDLGAQPQASYLLASGPHRIEFSGRSTGFKMDRFHLHLAGAAGANDLSVAESPRRFGDAYCAAASNSSGQVSTTFALGSPSLAANDVTLRTEGLPAGVLGYYIVSRNEAYVTGAGGGAGNLCVGSGTGRYAGNVLSSGSTGAVELRIDVTSIPQPTGAVAALAGETWRFQCWHRDAGSGGPTSNFSRGLRLTLE